VSDRAATAREPVRPDARLIFGLGGHEFSRRRGNEAILEFILALTVERPRICLLPTASGDATDQIAAFRGALGGRCEVSDLSLFRLEHESVSVREHLLSQDLIYIGGGSMVNMLAIWRAHGIDRILTEAWERGTVICGQSAGAMCWFEQGITRSLGGALAVGGLGVVPGVLAVHYHRDPDRRDALFSGVRSGAAPAYGVDDGAGMLIRGTEVATTVSGVDGAGVWRVEAGPDGILREVPLDPTPLPSPRPAIDELGPEVAELRELRRLRAPHARARASRGMR
jgi:peptidase E